MFAKATANFVRQIDPDGTLISVSRLNDSDKLVPMALVVKRNRFWFWQRPKYLPSDFTLSHLLLGDKELTPGKVGPWLLLIYISQTVHLIFFPHTTVQII